ncbi:hypothetical protein [Micromonospora costi]|uniref:Uncharacterized protein n=1 Tax=Micromonospora costi TaxID=1530042 RepID=A0A3B0A6N1_9ACTN|nr:hypothetical protein [Micromonospora costi]RKN56021.1 hypothetical protein D7193_15830 [Micromonospora costi]
MADYATLAAAHRAAVSRAADAGKALTLARHSLNAAGGAAIDTVRVRQLANAAGRAEAAYRQACREADEANAAATAANPNAEPRR